MSNLEEAVQLARELHAGQVDKAGEDYIEHVLRVMAAVEGDTTKMVAVLHDTLEDTAITLEELETRFGAVVAHAVQVLTRQEGEDYFDFIERIQQDPIARRVKLADLQDNMNLSRLTQVTETDLKRLKKYQRAFSLLTRAGDGLRPLGATPDFYSRSQV